MATCGCTCSCCGESQDIPANETPREWGFVFVAGFGRVCPDCHANLSDGWRPQHGPFQNWNGPLDQNEY